MKFKHILSIVVIILSIQIPNAYTQIKGQIITDTVSKITGDDDGRLFVMSKTIPILYLRYNNPNFDSILATLSNSQAFSSTAKITIDSQFNIIKAE